MTVLAQRTFRGTYISIDMMGFCFRLMMRARARVARNWNVVREPVDQEAVNVVFYRIFMEEVLNLIEKGITPIWVFEQGRHRLKTNVDEQRTLEREHTLERMTELRKELNTDVFASKNQRKIEELRQLESNWKNFPSEVKDTVMTLLLGLGFPCLKGKPGVEAERVASVVCMKDISAAVYSVDGDCLAHGAPIQIKEIGEPIYENGFGSESFVVVDRETLLELLDITSEQLTDVCICAGCDYNENMKDIRFTRALTHVRNYGSVLNFPNSMDRTCLNYEECVKEFGVASLEDLLAPECIEYYGLTTWEEFPLLTIQCPTKISSVLAECHLEEYEEQILRKISRVPPPEKYIHKEEFVTTIDGEEYKTYQMRFPEGGMPYTKPEKKKGNVKKQTRRKEEPIKVRTIIGNINDDDEEFN